MIPTILFVGLIILGCLAELSNSKTLKEISRPVPVEHEDDLTRD